MLNQYYKLSANGQSSITLTALFAMLQWFPRGRGFKQWTCNDSKAQWRYVYLLARVIAKLMFFLQVYFPALAHLSVKCTGLSPWKWSWQSPNVVHSLDVRWIVLNYQCSLVSSFRVGYWTTGACPDQWYIVLTSSILQCGTFPVSSSLFTYQLIEVSI